MSLFLCRVYVWQDLRDSSNRICEREETAPATGRLFILNTNRITDIRDLSTLAITRCSFQYADNPADRREGLSYVECGLSAAQLTAHFNDVPPSYAITLPIVPYNNPWGSPHFPLRAPVDTTVGIWSIAYVDSYNPDPNHYVWVCYYKGAFKRMEVLCDLTKWTGYPSLTTTTTTTEEPR